MPKITNFSRGPRTVNVVVGQAADGRPQVATHLIQPGQTSPEVNLVDAEDPVLKALVERGDLALDGQKARHLEGRGELAADRAKFAEQLEELKKRERELADRESEIIAQQDRFQRLQREAAMRAGATPGLADPLPPGTDTRGGEESRRALERAGLDPNLAGESNPAEGGADVAAANERHEAAERHESERATSQGEKAPAPSGTAGGAAPPPGNAPKKR